MSAAHTPGPWRLAGRETRNLPHSLVAADTLLARVYSKHFGDVQEETANARLIAAAPELLEALQAIVKSLADQDDEGMIEHAQQMIEARAAIAKATGETK